MIRCLVIDDSALPPDLSLVTGLHFDGSHLDHRLVELGLPLPGDVGTVADHLGRRRRGKKGGIRREEHLVRQDVLVVLVVERVGGHHVLVHRGVVGRAWASGALSPQHVGKAGVDVGGDGEAIGDEGGAMGHPNGVGAGEHDHVLCGEALGGEAGDELVEVEERRRQVVQGLRGVGDAAVEAAGRHVDLHRHPAEEVGSVTACEGDDVRAGDNAGAGLLDGVLGGIDDLEAAEAGEVGRAELLRLRVGRRRVEEDGGVAALHEAVVEEHADEAGADAGVLVDEALHLIPHDGLHARARLLVVAHLQAMARRRRQEQCACQRNRELKPGGSSHCLLKLAFCVRLGVCDRAG
ncbi:Peroxidase 2 [Hordeum vulgare]|nr:Peroxidase 2 [Hordeum vulgare]